MNRRRDEWISVEDREDRLPPEGKPYLILMADRSWCAGVLLDGEWYTWHSKVAVGVTHWREILLP